MVVDDLKRIIWFMWHGGVDTDDMLKHRKKQNPPPHPNCSPYMGDVCRGAFNNNITLSSSSSSLLSSSPGFMPPLTPIVNVAVIHDVGSQSFVEKRLASLKLGMMTSKTADDTCVRIATVYLCRLFFKTCGSHNQAFLQHEQQQQQRRRQRPRQPQFEDETPSSILSLLCYDDCKTFESEKCQAEREIIRLSSSAAEFSNLLPKDTSCVPASHGVGLYGSKPEKNPNHCIWRPPTSSPHDQVNHIIYIVAVLAASILIVCLLAIFIKRRCNSEEKSLEAKKKQLKDLESSNNSNALLSNNMMSKKAAPGMLLNGKEQSPTYQSNQFQSHYPNTVVSSSSSGHNSVAMYNNVPTVSAVNISFLYPIGSGHFGPVYAGQLIDHQSNIMFPQQQALLQQQKPVIVATLSEHADPTLKTRFEKELRSISSLRHDHQNVLKCVALCHAGSPRSLLYEFVDGVDLKQHLNLLTSTNSFDLPSALDYGCQVARGLEYMSEQGYYHGDLAARNVLVPKTADRCLRLTNLGVSRQVYEADYCLCPCQQVLSLRWCPTEQVVSGEAGWFTEIWSMGVLLWEIFTGGNRPYGILSDSQLLLEMQSGKQPVPQLPVEFPQEIRETVDGCWHPDPQRRVTASTLRKNLENAGLNIFNVTKNNGNIITVNNSALSGPNVASCQSNQNTLGPTFSFHSPQTVYTMHQQQKHLQKQNLTTGQTSSQPQPQQQQQQRLQQQQPLSPTTSSNHTSSTNLVNSPIKSCAINNLTPAVNTINDDDEDDDDYASDADECQPALKQYPC
ncbi:hypothetical protein HELRODRAFT_164816 [Helobdella robusta]|uniref:Protein kinase domain-containing protein n=1 Tax=Helobdella robusta TaxID=6412 RepID=T1EVU6_HELRO|nr:hypothetical protein HELRODRAFT_164816 [Helobdella robusta]ESN92720.1 hypothetical protein HELRODRAFT_164816 [Helobdella robusta]